MYKYQIFLIAISYTEDLDDNKYFLHLKSLRNNRDKIQVEVVEVDNCFEQAMDMLDHLGYTVLGFSLVHGGSIAVQESLRLDVQLLENPVMPRPKTLFL